MQPKYYFRLENIYSRLLLMKVDDHNKPLATKRDLIYSAESFNNAYGALKYKSNSDII